MELGEEDKKAIEDSKELINELGKHKDKDFIGRVYYKNKPIEDTLMLLLNIIERQQDEIDTWEETENDYEHELARNNEQISKQQREIEVLKEDLDKKVKALDIAMSNPDYISEDKIKEKLKELEEQKEKLKYDGNRSFADYEQFCKNLKFFKEQIEEILEDK